MNRDGLAWRCLVAMAVVVLAEASAQEAPVVALRPPTVLSNGWMRFEAQADPGPAVPERVLQMSSNLVDWSTLAVLPAVLRWD